MQTRSENSQQINVIPTQIPTQIDIPKQRSLNEVIQVSTLANENSAIQAKNILDAFNEGITKSCFTPSVLRGKKAIPGEFVLGYRNQRAELSTPHANRKVASALTFSLTDKTGVLGKFDQNKTFYGALGTYVLNVPIGSYAKAKSFNKSLLFGPGPHVIHDANFSFRKETDLVSQNEVYIQHQNLHILQIPSGKIAKIWIGAQPFLLESRPEPYVFDTGNFRFDPNLNLVDATANLIVHGSIKRLMPHTGTVAVTYNNGNLEIIPPSKNGLPTIIDSPNHQVDGFFNIGLRTLVFPSEKTKEQRRKENPKATTNEISLENFTTKDSLKVGIKLLVTCIVNDPAKALQLLGDEAGIIDHIENLAAVDMGKAIQQSSSQDFLNFCQSTASRQKPQEQMFNDPNQPSAPLYQQVQDLVKDDLANDLREFGIQLLRFNIETPKILNEEIVKRLSETSLISAQTSAKEANIEQNTKIAIAEAEQIAAVENIKQKQAIRVKLSNAETELKSTEMTVQATNIQTQAQRERAIMQAEMEQKTKMMLAETEQKTKLMQAETEQKTQLLKAETEQKTTILEAEAEKQKMDLIGKAYRDNVPLYDLEMKRLETTALGKLNLVPMPVAQALLNTFSIFANTQRQQSLSQDFEAIKGATKGNDKLEANPSSYLKLAK